MSRNGEIILNTWLTSARYLCNRMGELYLSPRGLPLREGVIPGRSSSDHLTSIALGIFHGLRSN